MVPEEPHFGGAFSLLNKGLDFRVKCQDTVPPAVNVLAVWVMPRCQALTVSMETKITNKLRSGHVIFTYWSDKKKESAVTSLSNFSNYYY